MQACDAMNVAEALPSLRAMAANPTPIPLRLAAIRALGRIGLPSDHELLRELSTQKGIHVFAARAALEAGRVTGPEGDGALPIRSRR